MVLMFSVPHFGVVSHAEDGKTIMVPVNKNYNAARFTLTFEYYDDCVVVVKSPSGKEYKGVILSENEVEAVVNDVEVGQWEVHINYPDIITSEEAPSESSEGEGDTTEETVQRRPISVLKRCWMKPMNFICSI